MIETLTLITLSFVLLILFRPGKTPPLDNPLVIERPGQFHMVLASKLNLAQPFIEAIAKQLASVADIHPNSATIYYEVSDKQVVAHGNTFYLLAITRRNNILYCQAVRPPGYGTEPHLDTIRHAAESVLSGIPAAEGYDEGVDEKLLAVVREVARLRGVGIRPITAAGTGQA
ncbi:MAG: hypothetical protein ABI479_08500 [Gallionella sp.]